MCYTAKECIALFRGDDYEIQEKLDAPMPWIGMYIAAASAVCSLAMAADAFNGFWRKRLWFPCKYFSLNAFSLTVLGVSMKLPIDLTSNTSGKYDKLARISSLVLMSTAMCNFMTSIGSMGNNEIILNIAALGILVITIAANVCIHSVQIIDYSDTRYSLHEEFGSTFVMLLLLVTICSLAMMVPSAKRYIESKYHEHKNISDEQVEWGKCTTDQLKIMVKRYWVMAATGSPQFVMARSVISGIVGLMCLSVAMTLVECYIQLRLISQYTITNDATSNYRWSINWILPIQCIGVALGNIAPLMRWFLAARFKISEIDRKPLRDEFKIEAYWTLRLVEWRESSFTFQIRHQKCRKLLHDQKRLILNICIGIHVFFVLTSKLVLLISVKLGRGIFFFFQYIKKLSGSSRLNEIRESEPSMDMEMDISRYVLLLEGEAPLPVKILKNICNEVDKLIQIGEERQPKNLVKLLRKSIDFNGMREFSSSDVTSLHSEEPPNCWSLPVVTLSSIAIALPNITTDKANQLLSGVSEGLSLVKLIEKTLGRNGELESVRNTADVVWVGIELYKKWQDRDLQGTSFKGRTHMETLEKLSDFAKKTVEDFKAETTDILMQKPSYWPVKVIAASSMYRIAQTILLANKDSTHQTGEELFERISVIISDILAACLTNLLHVITFKCHRNDMNERQESVGQAAILVGQSREILDVLQQRDLPHLNPRKAANIDEWRVFMEQDSENPLESDSAASYDSATAARANGEHVLIELEG